MVRVAAIQLCTGIDIDRNHAASAELIRAAAGEGAQYIQTPEMTPYFAENADVLFANIEPWENNASLRFYADLAAELKIHLHIGSLAIKTAPRRAANRAVLFGPDGKVITSYDKIHLFDVAVKGDSPYRESATYDGGDTAQVCELPFGKLGLSICYDVRFPALYKTLANAGAQIMAIPAAFTAITGKAHWETLLRARAIETGSFVIAAAQSGTHENGRTTHGHSMIINPWGDILAQAEDGECHILADLDLKLVEATRAAMPNLTNGREFSLSVNHSLSE